MGQGTLLGGYLGNMALLAGGPYLPLKERQYVLFLEDHEQFLSLIHILYAATDAAGAEALVEESGAIGLRLPVRGTAVAALAYDDVDCIEYFGEPLKAYWKRAGKPLEALLGPALAEYASLKARCDRFAAGLKRQAEDIGGEKYAEILALAYRQAIAAHKLCLDGQGQLLFISKAVSYTHLFFLFRRLPPDAFT